MLSSALLPEAFRSKNIRHAGITRWLFGQMRAVRYALPSPNAAQRYALAGPCFTTDATSFFGKRACACTSCKMCADPHRFA